MFGLLSKTSAPLIWGITAITALIVLGFKWGLISLILVALNPLPAAILYTPLKNALFHTKKLRHYSAGAIEGVSLIAISYGMNKYFEAPNAFLLMTIWIYAINQFVRAIRKEDSAEILETRGLLAIAILYSLIATLI